MVRIVQDSDARPGEPPDTQGLVQFGLVTQNVGKCHEWPAENSSWSARGTAHCRAVLLNSAQSTWNVHRALARKPQLAHIHPIRQYEVFWLDVRAALADWSCTGRLWCVRETDTDQRLIFRKRRTLP